MNQEYLYLTAILTVALIRNLIVYIAWAADDLSLVQMCPAFHIFRKNDALKKKHLSNSFKAALIIKYIQSSRQTFTDVY